ncbi:MAG TPA: sugar kinase [Dehalococcoidales bacterium]|nr:sugar kinase [Dehalococcoidales bacterium]
MADVVTFGETMVRLSPPDHRRLEQTNLLDVNIGGAEWNVAVDLSRLGISAAWVSRLTDNALGWMIRNKAREQEVDTSHIVWTKDDRNGIYFVEFGATPRPSSVLYDRSHTAISQVKPGEIKWEEVLKGAKWFHTSGITPALSPGAAQVIAEALQAAKKAGCKVSYDLNYRARLWTEEEARKCQEPLMEHIDVLFSTEEDTRKVLGITGKDYREVAQKLAEKFNFEVVCITLREDVSVLRNRWTAIAYSAGKIYDDRTYDVEIVDRVGAGDSYTAGFIYGYLTGDVAKGVKYGNAYSALKHSTPGDANWATLKEVENLLKGGALRISR